MSRGKIGRISYVWEFELDFERLLSQEVTESSELRIQDGLERVTLEAESSSPVICGEWIIVSYYPYIVN